MFIAKKKHIYAKTVYNYLVKQNIAIPHVYAKDMFMHQ